MPVSRRRFEWTAIATAVALLAVFVVLGAQARDWLLPNGQPVFGDFIAFWGAGRAALDGHSALVHDPAVLQAYQRQAIPDLHVFAGWNSPPPFLLIATALGAMPYPIAALAFLMAGGALYLIAATKLLPDRRALIFALTLPAALYHVGSVQTGLLIAGASGLALYWLDRRPWAAGAMIALLAIKPHMAVLWPIYLLLTGRWRAFAAAAVWTSAFVLAGGFAFGFDAYVRFLENLPATQDLITGQRVATPAYASLYGNLIGLGAPHVAAIGAQAVSAFFAFGAALWTFRRGEAATQGAALCAAALLVLPYAFFYDYTLLAVGAAMLGAPRNRFELAALVLAWSAGLSLVLGYLAPLPLGPLAAWMVLLSAVARARSAGAPLALTPRT
jgi:hypothetical protein